MVRNAQFWVMVSLGLMVKMVTAFGRGGQFLADGPFWLMVSFGLMVSLG